MTPADEITAAVEKLRTLVHDLDDCRGPWYVVNREQNPYPQRIDNVGVPYVVASTATDPSHPPTVADYIAAMHPGVGRALTGWLEVEAFRVLRNGRGPDLHHALAVARAINGSQP